jgi:hypothetical protein
MKTLWDVVGFRLHIHLGSSETQSVNWWGGCSSIYPNKPLLSLQMLAINFLF